MKRVGIFIAAGPALGLAVIMLLSLVLAPRFPDVHASAMFVLFAFAASLLPSFASGVADEALRSIWVTTTVGAAAAFLELRYLHGSAGALQIASFCMAGAIPAAACSWLSNEKQMRARTAH